MSGRISKNKSPKLELSTDRRNALVSAILGNPSIMAVCSYCERRGKSSCQASLSDSSRCLDCVQHGQSRCDIQGLSAQQIRRLGAIHQRTEAELDAAEEELERASAKVRRLRKQKKMWLEKMMRAVSRGIDTVEELERVEKEEAEREARRVEEQRPSSSGDQFSGVSIDPIFLDDDVALSPSFFVGMGVTASGSSGPDAVSGGTASGGVAHG